MRMLGRYQIKDYVSPCPVWVDSTMAISELIKTMEQYHVRYLPVGRNGRLDGVVEFPRIDGFVNNLSEMKVDSVMDSGPQRISSRTPLRRVVQMLADEGLKYVVVEEEDEGMAHGIFTVNDCLKLLRRLLLERESAQIRKRVWDILYGEDRLGPMPVEG
jgi:predicted transcriptional regulator